MSADAAVVARHVTKRFGATAAVDGLDLIVTRGTVLGLVGRNGAGKTTTLSMLASLLRPTSGELKILGRDPARDPRGIRARLGYLPDVTGGVPGVTVTEDLAFHAAARGVPVDQVRRRTDALLHALELENRRESELTDLSRGLAQRVGLARALVADPELLILDEPASGLDPDARIVLRRMIVALRRRGTTIVVSSHVLSDLERVCDEVAIIDAGRLMASGPPRNLVADLGRRPRRMVARLATGAERTFTVADDAAAARLLRRLVSEESRPVVSFRPVEDDLESLFVALTQGDGTVDDEAAEDARDG